MGPVDDDHKPEKSSFEVWRKQPVRRLLGKFDRQFARVSLDLLRREWSDAHTLGTLNGGGILAPGRSCWAHRHSRYGRIRHTALQLESRQGHPISINEPGTYISSLLHSFLFRNT